jgi:glucan biosynthesis protein C
MMLLGLLLHAALNYQPSPPDAGWPYRDPNQSGLAGLLILGIHVFRMPAFFLLAGFFAAMLQRRQGTRGFVLSRLQRIALPLLAGWVVLFPLVKLSFVFAATRAGGATVPDSLAQASALSLARPWADAGPTHLWFLYYLLMFYALSLPAIAIARLLPTRVRAAATDLVASVLNGSLVWLRLPLLVAATWLTLLPMRAPSIDTPGSFEPQVRILVCYAVFFAVGWLMYGQRAMIDGLKARAWGRLIAGAGALAGAVVLAAAWYIALGQGNAPASTGMVALRVVTQGGVALAAWLLILGGMGVAERMFGRPSRAVRYAVDSSYWIYVAHLPLCIAVPAMLRNWDAPGMIKMGVAISIALVVLLIGYEALRNILPRREGR